MVAINFIDGRWPKTVQEPESRIKDLLGDNADSFLQSNPFFIQLIYLTSATRWWINALNSMNDQLIAYVSNELSMSLKFCSFLQEIRLQNEEEAQSAASMSHQDINRALHAMAAHLHRYASELQSLQDTTAAVIEKHPLVTGHDPQTPEKAFQVIEDDLNQTQSQIKAIIDFEIELEKKIKDNLALVTTQVNKGS